MTADANFLDRMRAKAAEMGLNPSSVEGFADMDRETLVLQASLFWSMAMVSQKTGLDTELRLGGAICDMLDLCRSKGIDVPDELYDRVNPPEAGPKR